MSGQITHLAGGACARQGQGGATGPDDPDSGLTEEQIEQAMRARMEQLDQDYVTSRMTRAAYRARWWDIDEWARRQRAALQGK